MIYGRHTTTKEHRTWEDWMAGSDVWIMVIASDEGWVRWHAIPDVQCPLPDWQRASIRLRDGEIVGNVPHWDDTPLLSRRVIAYRPVVSTPAAPASDERTLLTWEGGECPVPIGTLVDVKHRCGTVYLDCEAGVPGSRAETWSVNPDNLSTGDIVAWRLSEQQPELPKQLDVRFFEPDMGMTLLDAILAQMPTEEEAREHILDVVRNMKDLAKRKGWERQPTLHFFVPEDRDNPLFRFRVHTANPRPDSEMRIACHNVRALGVGDGNEDVVTFHLPRTQWAAQIAAEVRDLCHRVSSDDEYSKEPPAVWALPADPSMLWIRPGSTRLEPLFRIDSPSPLALWEVVRGYEVAAYTAVTSPSQASPIDPDRPQPMADTPLWKLRELTRFHNCDYTPLPEEILKRIPDRVLLDELPHLAVKGGNVGKVAYTEKEAKGIKDVQSVMKPGKYLRRVLAEQIDDKTLKALVAEMHSHASFEVKTTTDAETIAWVYLNGPDSCMSHGEDRFDECYDLDGDWRHPMEVFDHPDSDVELVYVETRGRVGARALVNTESREYPSSYVADWAPHAGTILRDWLEVEGYSSCDDALYDQPLAKIPLRNGHYLCPYIDHGNPGVEIFSDRLVINGPYAASYSDGFVKEAERLNCDNCHEDYDEDDSIAVVDNDGDQCETVCPDCANIHYVEAWIDGSNHPELVAERDTIVMDILGRYGGFSCDLIHQDFTEFDRIGVMTCEESNDHILEDEAVILAGGDGVVHRRYVTAGHAPSEVLYPDRLIWPTPYILYDNEAWDPDDLAYDATNDRLIPREDLDEAEYTTEDGITYHECDEDAA